MVEQENEVANAADENTPEQTAEEVAEDAPVAVEETIAEEAVVEPSEEGSDVEAVAPESESAEDTDAAKAEVVAEDPAPEPAEAKTEAPAGKAEAAGAEAAGAEAASTAKAEETKDAKAPEAAADASGEKAKPASKKKRVRKSQGKPRRALEAITVGEKVNGRVVGLAKFGAFVDIGAKTDGLVHITQFPGRPKTVEEAVKSGDSVEVWVKEVDLGKGRVSLTMKQPAQNPLSGLKSGAVVEGTVTSVAQYGVFVDISSETEGLVHISEMSSGYVSKPEDIAKPGDTVEVRIKEIDAARKRISLSMVGLANDSGVAEGGHSHAEADYIPEPESDEPVPTVVELALRKALGEDDDDSSGSDGGSKRGKSGGRADMADLYAKMISDYKQTKAEESGDA